MTSFLIAIAMCYVLVKIPFWILGSIRGSKSRSVIGSMVRGFVAFKTFGLARAGVQAAASSFNARRVPHAAGKGWTDPYRNVEATPEGQTMLPLPGLPRTVPSAGPQKDPKNAESRGGPASRRDRSSSRSSGGSAGPDQHPRQGVLFTRTGKPKPDARPPQVSPGSYRWREGPGEQRMLPIVARHVPGRMSRENLGDELSRPREVPVRPPESEQPALFTPDGRIRSHARPPSSRPGAVPLVTEAGQQQYLNLPLRVSRPQTSPRPENTAGAEQSPTGPDEPAPNPRPVRGQMSLLRRDGTVTARARARPTRAAQHQAQQRARQVRAHARQQQQRRAQSGPAAPEFLAPRTPSPRRSGSRASRSSPPPTKTTPPQAMPGPPRQQTQQRSARPKRPQNRLGQSPSRTRSQEQESDDE